MARKVTKEMADAAGGVSGYARVRLVVATEPAAPRITWRRVRDVIQILEWEDGVDNDGHEFSNCSAMEQCTPKEWTELQPGVSAGRASRGGAAMTTDTTPPPLTEEELRYLALTARAAIHALPGERRAVTIGGPMLIRLLAEVVQGRATVDALQRSLAVSQSTLAAVRDDRNRLREAGPQTKPSGLWAEAGERLREARRKAGMNMGDLAAFCGETVVTISNAERGLTPLDSEQRGRVARALGIHERDLW